jgi:hypothetical protein
MWKKAAYLPKIEHIFVAVCVLAFSASPGFTMAGPGGLPALEENLNLVTRTINAELEATKAELETTKAALSQAQLELAATQLALQSVQLQLASTAEVLQNRTAELQSDLAALGIELQTDMQQLASKEELQLAKDELVTQFASKTELQQNEERFLTLFASSGQVSEVTKTQLVAQFLATAEDLRAMRRETLLVSRVTDGSVLPSQDENDVLAMLDEVATEFAAMANLQLIQELSQTPVWIEAAERVASELELAREAQANGDAVVMTELLDRIIGEIEQQLREVVGYDMAVIHMQNVLQHAQACYQALSTVCNRLHDVTLVIVNKID